MKKTENEVSNNMLSAKDGLKWAVVGYNKDNFTEEFISRHPMDFYESEDQIEGEYDIYLMNEHEYYIPSVEYRNGQNTGFKSGLCFFGYAPNYDGEGDFRLKHLRMLMGTEDFSFYPIDFADICSLLGNKYLTIDSSSFSEEDSVSTIVKWIRDEVDKRHSIKNNNVVIVYEGNDIAKAGELSEEISDWFGVEVEALALYSDESESGRINISFIWYEAIDKVRGLREHWDRYYDEKDQYLSGDKTIDMDDFCELVRRTWWYIWNIDFSIDNSLRQGTSSVEVGKSFMLGFHEYIKIVERLTYYSVLAEKDNSKDYLFTVTAMLADELSRLAAGKKSGTPTYNMYGEYYGFSGSTMDVTLAAPHPSSSERVQYSIEEKNYQILLEPAKRINEEKE